jgi:tetratricopeptide (TPR) repeat protein
VSEYDEIQVSEWLRDGIAAAKAGRRAEARELLMRVIEANERDEQAWLWLSGVVDTDEDRLICLENVLTIAPDNVQAQAGLKWLQKRGVGEEERGEGGEKREEEREAGDRVSQFPASPSPQTSASQEPDLFMTPDGCVYCGLPVGEGDVRCPHCGGRLMVKQFKHQERSATAYFLQPFWTVLAGVNLVVFFFIGFIWDNIDKISPLITPYLSYLVGSAVTDPTSVDTFIEPELLLQIVRFTLFGLAVLGGLVALGVFLRVARAHPLGLALVLLHLVIYVALFFLGVLGYLIMPFLLVLVILLTRFMFQTVEDFSKEERRERLEPDRHLLNDVDYYTRGRAYEKQGMWAKALLHWQRAVAINPNRDTYFAAMARAYAYLGRYETALAHMDDALRVSRTPGEWEPLREIIVAAQRRAAAD